MSPDFDVAHYRHDVSDAAAWWGGEDELNLAAECYGVIIHCFHQMDDRRNDAVRVALYYPGDQETRPDVYNNPRDYISWGILGEFHMRLAERKRREGLPVVPMDEYEWLHKHWKWLTAFGSLSPSALDKQLASPPPWSAQPALPKSIILPSNRSGVDKWFGGGTARRTTAEPSWSYGRSGLLTLHNPHAQTTDCGECASGGCEAREDASTKVKDMQRASLEATLKQLEQIENDRAIAMHLAQQG